MSLQQQTWRGLDPGNCPFDECAEVPAELGLHLFRLLFRDRTLNYIESYTCTVILTFMMLLIAT